MSVYGDLDLSFIKTKPAERLPIITKVEDESGRASVYSFCREELAKGHKVFMLYPLVDESEKLDLKSVEESYESICEAFPGYSVAMLHGRMNSQQKDSVMLDFKSGRYQILVSTTVIEVGIDIPEATVIIINHAERFGLSQLHQLRGRVGRSTLQSYCFLLTESHYRGKVTNSGMFSSSSGEEPTAVARLRVMEESNDGFYISEKDLEIRGPGDLLGVRQSGLPDFRFADLAEDIDIIKHARDDATKIIAAYQQSNNYKDYIGYLSQSQKKAYITVG
jgi:ATP-dependent DNA helicase RecG